MSLNHSPVKKAIGCQLNGDHFDKNDYQLFMNLLGVKKTLRLSPPPLTLFSMWDYYIPPNDGDIQFKLLRDIIFKPYFMC